MIFDLFPASFSWLQMIQALQIGWEAKFNVMGCRFPPTETPHRRGRMRSLGGCMNVRPSSWKVSCGFGHQMGSKYHYYWMGFAIK